MLSFDKYQIPTVFFIEIYIKILLLPHMYTIVKRGFKDNEMKNL